MNGRLYDPMLHRFLAPDNYVQDPYNTQNFNRYGYVLNNPLMYTDPSGEFWHIVIGAVVGGVVNLATNWNNIDNFWEGVAAFGVGAGAGALIAATGGAGAGFWATAGVSSLGGAATMGTNGVIAQTGNGVGLGDVDWGRVGESALVGAAAGFAGGAAGHWAANSSVLVNNINSPILRSAVVSPLASGAGHIAGGTTSGMFRGQSLGTAFSNSFDGLGQSMAMGASIGVASTVGVSFANGVNPLNGKMMWPGNNGFDGTPQKTILKEGTIIDRYGDEYGRFAAPQGTPFGARSLPPNAKSSSFNTYEIVKPLPALQGPATRSFWFNSSGGGQQYMFSQNINYLLQNGYLIKIPY